MIAFASCGKDTLDGPNNKKEEEDNNNEEKEYTVDKYGYATFVHNDFSFKMKEADTNTKRGREAIEYMKEDLDHIVAIIPEEALEVMRKRPIWMERNNSHNPSAAWYHTWEGYPASIGDIDAKGKCVEITNYDYYISWTDINQPLMVLHELCHLKFANHGDGFKNLLYSYMPYWKTIRTYMRECGVKMRTLELKA